ncbi:MAG: CDP-alcohol phosphatidyltransferase family protein [Brevinematales bacterium]|nr:CDP-alcohol phosphatidyltransferase family protein [Brevinematales bacterium]
MQPNFEKVLHGDQLDRFWTIPNMLSILRIILSVPIGILLWMNTPVHYLWAFIIVVIAYITDWLDGWIARATNSESRYGKMLDPIGDKLIAAVISLVLLINGLFPLYLFLTIVIRDLGITIGGLYAIKRKNLLANPNIVGKISTLLLGILLPFYTIKYSTITLQGVSWLNTAVDIVVIYGSYLACALLIVSAIMYGVAFFRNIIKSQDGGEK